MDSAVELIVAEGQRTRIALARGNPRIGVSLPQCLDELLLVVDRLDGRRIHPRRNQERQAAGPAANIDNVLAVGSSGKIQKQWRQAHAPPSHELIVAVSALCNKGSGHVLPRYGIGAIAMKSILAELS